MCGFAYCRNHHLPLLFLLFCHRCRHHHEWISPWYCQDNVAQWQIWHGGCQADGSNTEGGALPHLVKKASQIVWYIITLCISTKDTTHNNPKMSVDMLWPKWATVVALVPSPRNAAHNSHSAWLADWRCMRRRWEWGTMVAVAQWQPPQLVGAWFS